MKETLWSLIACCTAVLSACSWNKAEDARRVFDSAMDEYNNKHFNQAKLLLDSVIFTYPDNKQLINEAQNMMKAVYRSEQEENLCFLDSLLALREGEVRTYMQQFYIEDEQNENPVLIHKKQSAQSAYDRSYVRAYTDQKGTFYMSSHYTGENHIWHTGVKVQVGESYAQTDSVTNEALNHAFDNDGQVWEVVKYKDGRDNGAAAFIARNADKRIVVTYIGPKSSSYKIVMTETDKIAMRDTYQLSMLLRETIQIKSQIRNVRTALTQVGTAPIQKFN